MSQLRALLLKTDSHYTLGNNGEIYHRNGEEVPLTTIEKNLIRFLTGFKNLVLTSQQIMGELFVDEAPWDVLAANLVIKGLEEQILSEMGETSISIRSDRIINIGDLTVDIGTLTAVSNGNKLALSSGEFSILSSLAVGYPEVVSYETLYRSRARRDTSRTVSMDSTKVYVLHLRKKLVAVGGRTTIVNRQGFGYLIVEN